MGLCINSKAGNHSCLNSDSCPNNNKNVECLIVQDKKGKVSEKYVVEGNKITKVALEESEEVTTMCMPSIVAPKKNQEQETEGNPMPPIVNKDRKVLQI